MQQKIRFQEGTWQEDTGASRRRRWRGNGTDHIDRCSRDETLDGDGMGGCITKQGGGRGEPTGHGGPIVYDTIVRSGRHHSQ